MCGRFVQKSPKGDIARQFDVRSVESLTLPSFNLAPTQPAAIVYHVEDERKLSDMWWGLIPSWAKDPSIGQKLINARSETVREKPSFRTAFKKTRCIIPANAFYEWKKDGSKKIPMAIRLRTADLFGIAGLYERWKNEKGELIHTFTILTTEPNSLMSSIHNRMPVILSQENYNLWLDSTTPAEILQSLLTPYDALTMEAFPVSTFVNSPKNNLPDLLFPV